MKSQRVSAAMQTTYYYGDDCPSWAFCMDNQKAIDKQFNEHLVNLEKEKIEGLVIDVFPC